MRERRSASPDQLRLLPVMGGRGGMHVVADGPLDGSAAAIFGGLAGTEWQEAASVAQVVRILDQISTDVAAGAVGVGVLIGHTPESIRPSTSLLRSPWPPPGSRCSRTHVTSSSWLRRR